MTIKVNLDNSADDNTKIDNNARYYYDLANTNRSISDVEEDFLIRMQKPKGIKFQKIKEK